MEFMSEVSRLLVEFSKCDAVEMRLYARDRFFLCEANSQTDQPCRFEAFPPTELKRDWRRFAPKPHHVTPQGSLWTGNAEQPFELQLRAEKQDSSQLNMIGNIYKSLAFLPFKVDEEKAGLLVLKSTNPDYFDDEIEFYEGVAQTVGLAVSDRKAQAQLRERVKELTCLYQIAQLVERPDISMDEILQGIVEILPPAWLYPQITQARIILDDKIYQTPNFQGNRQKLKAHITVDKKQRGLVEVVYSEEKPEIDEGPFLKEERNLINEIARQLAHRVERRQAEAEKQKLQEQLRHADRLATIGQLAAGVAHELNEPLGGILGFAQLASKDKELPKQTHEDLARIVKASLHAREVVKKLMLFARQMPPRDIKIDLNRAVEDSLYFLESRCAKSGVEMVSDLSRDLPEIIGDLSQLQQVVINLVVNSIQAMSNGGRLLISTFADKDHVFLAVEDTGVGMSEDIKQQAFVPFFTTKDVNEGTGLGLSVVHGIVVSHGGSIQVESEPGLGSRFEIQLPIRREQNNI
jgi:signal transduction histidine kinase